MTARTGSTHPDTDDDAGPVVHEVHLLPEAQVDLKDIIEWYDRQVPGLGRAFTADLGRVIRLVSEFPAAYPLLSDTTGLGVRRADLTRFPYSTVYRLRGGAVEVGAVLHQHSHPNRFIRRSNAVFHS
jgi:plasmid stabilization system protein ParE